MKDLINQIEHTKFFLGANYPFYDVCVLYTLTVNDVVALGDRFGYYLNLLTMDEDGLLEVLEKKGITEVDKTPFQYLMLSAENDELFFLDLQKAFYTFTREKVIFLFDRQEILFPQSKKVLNEQGFSIFQFFLREQYKLDQPEEVPEDESPIARKFRLKRKYREKIKKQKQEKNGDIITVLDMISSICIFCGYTPKQVGELSYYALKDLYNRFMYKQKYDNDIQFLCAGADAKKIKINDWTRKLKID